MSSQNKMLHIKKQLGLSIVELMVTLVLSLFIMLITTGFYVNNKSTYRFIESSGNVQENGRYAIHFLRENIANAGFPKDIVNAFPTTDLPSDGPDQISVSYQGTEDCVGAPVAAIAQPVISRFTVVGGNLLCNGQVLITGIENLQIEYGVDTDADGIPNTYQAANTIAAATFNSNVVAVRLAIVISSQNQVRDQASAETYQLLGTSWLAPNDRLHRRVFTTTIPLRNRSS